METYQKLGDAAVPGGKFMVVNAYIYQLKKIASKQLMLYLKELQKEK